MKTTYNGFTIEQNQYGFFNVVSINCFASSSIESAKRAIDRYVEANDLCEHGVPRTALEPQCGCPSRKYSAGVEL